MRIAQGLYMKVIEIPGEGQVGLITYMRTDSTHLSGGSTSNNARELHRATTLWQGLPPREAPNFFGSTQQGRPGGARGDPSHRSPMRTPGFSSAASLTEDQFKLYSADLGTASSSCQMTNGEVRRDHRSSSKRSPTARPVPYSRANGRVLVFDGFMDAWPVSPPPATNRRLPAPSGKGDESAPFSIVPKQKFTSPPPRYNEGSLVKKLEEEGIGRPSTYASIIRVIQDRGYVEQVDRRFHATAIWAKWSPTC